MILAVAIPAGLASAVAYGVSAAVQHDATHTTGGRESAAGLRALLRDPRWWASILGDTLGLLLQLLALAFGPVVLVQPLFVLCLLVALPVRRRLGGPPVTRRDGMACALLVAGLAVLFALLGDPGGSIVLPVHTTVVLFVVAALAAGAIVGASARLPGPARAVVWSAVAGGCFGVEAVLVNVIAAGYDRAGWASFATPVVLVPLVAAVVLGLGGFALSLVAFQVGTLAASFPAMLVVDPLVAVILGAALLGEHVPTGPGYLIGYVACLAGIGVATAWLAAPTAATAVQTA